MACVTACPSGVQYDRLLESVRPQIERNVERDRGDQLFRDAIFALFPYKRRLRAAALPGALYQKLRRIPAIAALAEKLPGRLGRDGVAAAAGDGARGVRDGCPCTPRPSAPAAAGSRCSPAACRTCSSTGSTRPPCACWPPRATTCSCRATSSAAARWSCTPGREEPALGRARRTIARFESLDVDAIVTNVAGCGSSMKEYGHLLVRRPGVGRARGGVQRPRSATCTRCWPSARETRRRAPRAPGPGPRRLPRRLPPRARPGGAGAAAGGAAHDPGAGAGRPRRRRRCAAARPGIYNMVAPEAAAELGARKAANVRDGAPGRRGHGQPGLPAADRQAPRRRRRRRCCTRSSCWTPASAAPRCRTAERSPHTGPGGLSRSRGTP